MTFDDVESARRAYNNKKIIVKKQALKIVLPVVVMLAISLVVLNAGALQLILTNFSEHKSVFIVPILIGLVFLVLLPFVIISIMMSIFTRRELRQYKKVYKSYFVEKELKSAFTDIEYFHALGLNKFVLESTGMINMGDRYYSNDFTIGKYKNVNFAQADVHIENIHANSNGGRRYHTVFRGRYMVFEFPKKFNFKMVLSPYKRSVPSMKRIETESVDFNRTFFVYAENGVEAFYILTPDIMEKMQELGRTHDNKVSIYFAENKMVIGINDGDDIFEPPNPKKPLNEKIETAKVNNEINLVTSIVDNLKLSRKM